MHEEAQPSHGFLSKWDVRCWAVATLRRIYLSHICVWAKFGAALSLRSSSSPSLLQCVCAHECVPACSGVFLSLWKAACPVSCWQGEDMLGKCHSWVVPRERALSNAKCIGEIKPRWGREWLRECKLGAGTIGVPKTALVLVSRVSYGQGPVIREGWSEVSFRARSPPCPSRLWGWWARCIDEFGRGGSAAPPGIWREQLLNQGYLWILP